MTPTEILIAARAKIEKPECWTRGALARDRFGELVCPESSDAVCFCGYGAIDAVEAAVEAAGTLPFKEATDLLDRAAAKVAGFANFPALNDACTSTHADVLAAFDRAIALSQAA